MTAVFVVGLFFPGAPMLLAGILLARFESHHRWLATWRLRRQIQWAEESNERLEKRWKRVCKSRSKLLVRDHNQIPLSICIDGHQVEVVTEQAGQPFVYAGMQTSDEGLFPSWAVYKLLRDIPGLGPYGTTVAGASLRAAGFDVPEMEAEAVIPIPIRVVS